MHTVTENFGLAGGTLDASKHILLAADPAAYMVAMSQRPWMRALSNTDADRFARACVSNN